MNNLEYKGYYGSIEYGTDKRLYGSVLGMTIDSISYEGDTFEELEKDFKDGVDSYLDGCKELGIMPRKGYNGVLNIFISPETHNRMAIYAQNSGTTIDAFISDSIERRLKSIRN